MNGFHRAVTLSRLLATGLLAAGLVPAGAARSLHAQLPIGVERSPDAARITLDDLDRFAGVYRRLIGTADTTALFDSAYVDRGTVGLNTYAALYDVDAGALTLALRNHPDAFRQVALLAPVVVRALDADLRAAFRRLAELYPEALFPPVFLLVGRNHAGGAVQAEGILIAVETYANRNDRSLGDLVHLVAHELAHFQQAAYNVGQYQQANSLLARAIKEGAADYVAELLTGDHINRRAHRYGNRNEWELWDRFRCVLDETDTGDWFFRQPQDAGWPPDLGYFIGYRIAAARYSREVSPAHALRAVLQVDDYQDFLRASGYEAYLERREGRRFDACS